MPAPGTPESVAACLAVRRRIVRSLALLTVFVGWTLGIAGSLGWFPLNPAQARIVVLCYLVLVPTIGVLCAVVLPLRWYRRVDAVVREIAAGREPGPQACGQALADALRLPLRVTLAMFVGTVTGYALGITLLRIAAQLPYIEIFKTALQAPMIGVLYGLVAFFLLERVLRPAVRELTARVGDAEVSVPRLPLFQKLLAGTVAVVALACLSVLFSLLVRVQRQEERRIGSELADALLRAAAASQVHEPVDPALAKNPELARWIARGAYAFVVDTDGRILTPHPAGYTRLAQEQLYDPAPLFETRAGYFADRVGTHRLVAHAPLSLPARRLVAVLPLDRVLTIHDELWRAGLAMVFLSMALSAGLGMLFARHVAEPVRILTETARSVTERGDLSIRSSLRTTDEIGDLSRAFDRMTAQIQRAQDAAIRREKLAALGQLLSGTAHELNNPLAAILMNAQLLNSEELPASARELARTIEAEARRSAKIVGNLLSFARPRPPERKAVALNDVVRKAVDFHRYEVAVTGIHLVERYEPGLPEVYCDPDQIQQVVLNLVQNARQAVDGRPDAEIRVATRRANGSVEIVVEDTGPGLPADVRAHIFDPFFTTRTHDGGTGLGLFVVHQIVREHGGEIEAGGEPGRGARFTVRLPIGRPEFLRPTLPPPAPTPVPAGARGRPLSVLLVDDEEAIAKSAASYLQRLGHEVCAVASGREAWDAIRRRTFDVIVTDLRLPDLPGDRLYALLEQSRPELARRTVFMTGDTVSEETRARVRALGRPCLEKPFSLERLGTEVERVGRGAEVGG